MLSKFREYLPVAPFKLLTICPASVRTIVCICHPPVVADGRRELVHDKMLVENTAGIMSGAAPASGNLRPSEKGAWSTVPW
jgi:hypothetical protein